MLTIRNKLILLTISLLLLMACASNLDLISEDVYLAQPDKFSPDTELYAGSKINIKPVTFGGSGFSEFRLSFQQNAHIEIWALRSYYLGKEWLFVNRIKFLVDEDIYEFESDSNPFRKVGYPLGGSDVYEENNFIITTEFCHRILTANKVSVRIIGRNLYIDRDLSLEDITKLRNFIKYINEKILTNKNVLNNNQSKSLKEDENNSIITDDTTYTFIDNINKFLILLNKYNGHKVEMKVSLKGIITKEIAWFTDETYGILSVQYNKCSEKSLENFANLKIGEYCIIKGIGNSSVLGNPGIIAVSIEKE